MKNVSHLIILFLSRTTVVPELPAAAELLLAAAAVSLLLLP